MKTWFTKEFSTLVNVSVRTLHYYDKIGLLKPSLRQDNDYRLYSEKDLVRLQQIIALKYFGFELSHIKTLLSDNATMLHQFGMQSRMLKKKADALVHASQMLSELVSQCQTEKSIEWQQLIKMIEVFQMTQQLEHTWVKEIYNDDELKQYAEFETKMKQGSKEEKAALEKRWHALINDLNAMLDIDPRSVDGIKMGERFMIWTNELYGKEYAHLRTKKFEQGFGEGKGLDDTGLTPASVKWLSEAMDAYWRDRIYSLLNKVNNLSDDERLSEWHAIMDDMYGNETSRKEALIDIVLVDDKVSSDAKAWLKTLKSSS